MEGLEINTSVEVDRHLRVIDHRRPSTKYDGTAQASLQLDVFSKNVGTLGDGTAAGCWEFLKKRRYSVFHGC